MATPFEKFTSVLKELFMLDQADLDFGIYRIINQKRKEIERFLNEDLKKQVQALLKENDNSDVAAWHSELKKLVSTLKDAGINPDDSPKVQELKNKLATTASASEMEGEVYSHLATFFNRYYDNGDFMSNRRYKKDVYAIPYEGEEVKLHWANADQYYIKTSENFQDYSFKTANDKTIHFRLRDASTEMNNNKTQADQERRFAIAAEDIFEVKGDELSIFFTYEPKPKSIKQKDLTEEAISVIMAGLQTQEMLEPYKMGLLALAATEKNKNRTLLEKHLTDYVSKNSFDYFIHKDLGGFLRRELDFYIKNEVLFIDDISSRSPEEFVAYLTQVKTIKAIGDKLITFLAQLEDFQKKLWLKKKFVVETNYCITLDRVPEELYSDIIANDAQREEWVRLFAIDEIKGSGNKRDIFDTGTPGFSIPLTSDFLKENPFLVLDTAFFDNSFKHRLISSIDNFEEQLDGTLINSENFQALNLLQDKYYDRVKGIYTDPPYNTSASEILYRNSYKHSSWMSLMYDRIVLSKFILQINGIACFTIDDFELDNLRYLIDSMYGRDNLLANVAIRNNPSGRSTVKGFSINHEYGLFYANGTDAILGRLPHNEKQKDRYSEKDDYYYFEWENLRRNGPDSNKEDRPKQFYPIIVDRDTLALRLAKMSYDENTKEWTVLEEIKPNEFLLYPIHPNGDKKVWRYSYDNIINEPDRFIVTLKNDRHEAYRKKYLNSDGVLPRTWWDNPEYSARDNGTRSLVEFFGKDNQFDFPKAVNAVSDSIKVLNVQTNEYVLDFFAGSGTTGHAVINLNREDEGNRKYILIEMGNHFDTVTKPRIEKVIYSKDWKNGKPVSREGSSHCFKYLRLEQYEDTLNNLIIQKPNNIFDDSEQFQEGYLLSYMMDIETRGSLFNLKWFVNPFDVKMKITKQNELKETKIDLVETFNYLVGLNVYNTSYPKVGLCVVEGTTRTGEKSLMIWRDCKTINNEALNEFFTKSAYSTLDHEYDRIYVNGDNLLQNIRKDEDHWKVVLIEEEFSKRMFEV